MGGALKRQIRIEGEVAFVPLTKGYEAVIDAADVPLVDGFNWYAMVDSHTVYAMRSGPRPQQRTVRMHRVLMGEPAGLEVDHRDGDGLNNRRSNLRKATHSQNTHNTRISARNSTGFKGVSRHKQHGKWQAYIMLHRKQRHLGYFDTPEEAYAAYCRASAELHGEYGRIA